MRHMERDLTDLPLRSGEPAEPEREGERERTETESPRPSAERGGEAAPIAASRRRAKPARGAGDRVLAVVAVFAVLAGLTWGGPGNWMWRNGLWALFAVGCALTQLVSLLGSGTGKAWQVAAVASAGLAAFWLLVVLPAIGSNAGFLLTVGAAAAGGALWLAPGRPR